MRISAAEGPLISVIVPVYNVAPFLPACLDSIINQTYKNLEILIVASTSTDNSVEICDDYKEKDTRITVIHSPVSGLSDARNRGIDSSHGEYLCFIDSDDFIAPDFIQALYDIIENSECEIAQCEYFRVPENQNTIPNIYYTKPASPISVYSGMEMLIKMNSSDVYVVMTWNKLYHRSLFADIRYPFGKIIEDVATTYQLYYSAKKIGHTKRPLYFHRMNPTSIMGQPFSEKRLDVIEHAEEMVKYFIDREEYEIYGVALTHQIIILHSAQIQTRKHLPNSEQIQKQILEKTKKAYAELRKHRTAGIYYKSAGFLMTYLPDFAEMMLVIRRRFVAKKYSRGGLRPAQKTRN